VRFKKLISIVLLGYLLMSQVFGQGDNHANRYDNAYKKYLDASCPVEVDSIRHFVYFASDREGIHNHAFLSAERFEGAQIMYPWKLLEPEQGRYDFSMIREDYAYLQEHGKQLFIQLQDATFSSQYIAIPSYLLTREYDGGVTAQFNDDGVAEGWVAKRWNPKVRHRFALFLEALGEEFDGKIEGINLQETAIGVSSETDTAFTPERYVESLMMNMLALKKAFPTSTTMLYANFMPGEWLPWEDKGYLRSLYQYGQTIGVGLGGPDLMVQRKGQLNHALAMMHESDYTVPLGIAVQDGNYIGTTGADRDYDEHQNQGKKDRENKVPLLHAFAIDFLKVDYMFWVNQEPYFSEDVIPCLSID
jgi:hypothetical protein